MSHQDVLKFSDFQESSLTGDFTGWGALVGEVVPHNYLRGITIVYSCRALTLHMAFSRCDFC